MASSALSPSSEGSLSQAEEKVRLRVSYGGTFVLVRPSGRPGILPRPGGPAAAVRETLAGRAGQRAVEAGGRGELPGVRLAGLHVRGPVLEARREARRGVHPLRAARREAGSRLAYHCRRRPGRAGAPAAPARRQCVGL